MNNLHLMGGVHAATDVPEDTQSALGLHGGVPGHLNIKAVAREILHGNGVGLLDA